MCVSEDQRNVAAPLFGVHTLAAKLEHLLRRTIPFWLQIVELFVKRVVVIRIQIGCSFEPHLHPGTTPSLSQFDDYHLASNAFITGVQLPGLVERLLRFAQTLREKRPATFGYFTGIGGTARLPGVIFIKGALEQ